jgi:hypothetical protein
VSINTEKATIALISDVEIVCDALSYIIGTNDDTARIANNGKKNEVSTRCDE